MKNGTYTNRRNVEDAVRSGNFFHLPGSGWGIGHDHGHFLSVRETHLIV
jgi:hypothetical protein